MCNPYVIVRAIMNYVKRSKPGMEAIFPLLFSFHPLLQFIYFTHRLPVYVFSAVVFVFLISGCSQDGPFVQPASVTISEEQQSPSGLVIAAVGDVMMPGSIQAAAKRNKDDYNVLFEKISGDLAAADIVFANLETPMDHKAKPSGYPKFNVHPGLAIALKNAGITIVSVANNHALDMGVAGLTRTLQNLEAAGVAFTGAGRTKAEAAEIKYVTVRGIKVAFFSYTYGVNQGLPKKATQGVNLLGIDADEDLLEACSQIRIARSTADLLVVSMHWGEEYQAMPSAWQRHAAIRLVEAGADIILGHHPHVLQPIETIESSDGRQGLVAFSLGNFISSQNVGIWSSNRNHVNALRGDGIILYIFIVKKRGHVAVEHAEFLPLWTLRETTGTGVVYRPVNIAREIRRIKTEQAGKDLALLNLLTYRNEIIRKQFTLHSQ